MREAGLKLWIILKNMEKKEITTIFLRGTGLLDYNKLRKYWMEKIYAL